MKRNGSKVIAINEEEAHGVPVSSEIEALLHQALKGDQEGWAAVEQYLGETMRSWLHGHPSKEVACCWESEEHYVALALPVM